MPNYQGVWSLTTQMQNVSDWPEQPIGGGGRAVFSIGVLNSSIVNTMEFTTILTGSTFTDLVMQLLHHKPEIHCLLTLEV